ncbi:hypothetical protein EV175_001625 [Coemansia sp. RSA 1933]|nr:hypothetical protein EV175_001625 [Coemansia sp. RSA 1933]
MNAMIKRAGLFNSRSFSLFARAVPQGRRAAVAMAGLHSKIEITEIDSKHLSPIEFHNYLKNRGERQELKEFLSEESEIVSMDAFNDPPPSSFQQESEPRIDNKDLNEQFRKQIGNLLGPSYGSS